MIGRPEYTLTLPPACPTNRDHLNLIHQKTDAPHGSRVRCLHRNNLDQLETT